MPLSGAAAPPSFVRLAAHPLRWWLLTELARSDLRVRELVALLGQPQNLVSYHLRLLRDGGLVTAARSSFDGRDSYYRLDLDRCGRELAGTGAALHPALRTATAAPPVPADQEPADQQPADQQHADQQRAPRVTVLFVCTGNSARSPIAEALLHCRSAGHVDVASAGTRPKPRLHPNTVRVLRDGYGIDITRQRPRHLDAVARRRFDYLITLCDKAREVRPGLGQHPRWLAHWSVPDPAAAGGTDLAGYPAFERVAADIDTRIRHLLPVLGAP